VVAKVPGWLLGCCYKVAKVPGVVVKVLLFGTNGTQVVARVLLCGC